MKRVIIATVLLTLALEMVVVSVVILLTPLQGTITEYFSPPPPKPVLTPQGTPPTTTSSAAYLLDADTGYPLMSVNGNKTLPMASVSKIMTGIIAIEQANPNMAVTIKQDALNEVTKNEGSSANLVLGDQLSMKDMVYGLMIPSGDDAAVAIADAVSGTQTNFVTLMNSYAKKLHMTGTNFINASGLTYNGTDGKFLYNTTTARDLAILTAYAMKNDRFSQIVRVQGFTVTSLKGHPYTWYNTDELLGTYIGALGVKTGYTPEAGYCLTFSAEHNGHTLIGVVLNEKTSAERFTDATNILNWGFGLPLKAPSPKATPII